MSNNTVSTNILTESVDAKALNTTLKLGYTNANEILIGSNTTTPQITIDTLSTLNTNASPAIAIGTSSSAKTIKINNSTNSVHLSGLDIKGTGLNNITATSGQVDIAQLQTSGNLNIATNASRTSDINIGSATNTGAISLQTASTLNTDGSPAISIGTSGSAKTIKLNNSTNSVICSGLDIKGTGINGIVNASGQVDIAQLQTSGNLNIATNASRTSDINVGSATNTGAISLQTASTLNTDGSPAISIGTAGSVKTIKVGSSSVAQTVNVAGMTTNFNGTTTNKLNPLTASHDLLLGSNQNSGILYLGAGDGVARSGNIQIGTGTSSSNQINILNGGSASGSVNIMNGSTNSGSVNIANGTGATQTTSVNISTGTTTGLIAIGNGSSTTRINGACNFARNVNGTNPTYFELSSSTTNNFLDFHCNSAFATDYDVRISATGGTVSDGQGTLTITGASIGISGALTYSSTIGASYSSLPARAVTDIGYIYTGTAFNATTPASGSTVSSITIATAGVYMVSFAYYTLSTAKPTELYCNLSGGEINGVIYGNTNINATNSMVFGTQIFKQDTSASTTYGLVMARTGGTAVTTTTASCYLKAVKIA